MSVVRVVALRKSASGPLPGGVLGAKGKQKVGENSKIEWTHHTFNPWHGCSRVSPGCENCYAEAFSKRLGRSLWGVQAERRFFGDKHWAEPVKWNASAAKRGVRERVFCASMADVFEEREDLVEPRARLYALIDQTPHLDWLLLTKRPENADRLWMAAHDVIADRDDDWRTWRPNVWLGTTCEDQPRADERIPHLLRVPAALRFLSCEPLLGPLDFTSERRYWMPEAGGDCRSAIDWVIVGGESGHGARPFDLAWARSIVEQCKAAGVAVHVKQMGSVWARENLLNGYDDTKGGDMDRWPAELRVREYPKVTP